MSIVTGYKTGGIDLGSIFVNQTGGATVTGYKTSTGADLGELFRNQTGGTTVTGYKTSTGADLGSLFALAVVYNYTALASFHSTDINYPCGICIDTNYNLFFANGHAAGGSNGYLSKINTEGTKALTNLPTPTPLSITNFIGICIDNNNNVYPTSYTNNVVYKYVQGASISSLITSTNVQAVAVDNAGNVFVGTYSSKLSVFLLNSGTYSAEHPIITNDGATKTYATAATSGTKASDLSCGSFTKLLINNNKLYVCDAFYGCIFYFSVSDILSSDTSLQYGNAPMTKFAGTGTYVSVKTISTSPQVLAINSTLTDSYGICFDSVGNAYIAEWTNGTIKKVDTSGYISMLVGPTIVTGTGSATIKYDFKPIDLCIKSTNNYMYVTDNLNNKIVVLT